MRGVARVKTVSSLGRQAARLQARRRMPRPFGWAWSSLTRRASEASAQWGDPCPSTATLSTISARSAPSPRQSKDLVCAKAGLIEPDRRVVPPRCRATLATMIAFRIERVSGATANAAGASSIPGGGRISGRSVTGPRTIRRALRTPRWPPPASPISIASPGHVDAQASPPARPLAAV